MRIGIILQHFDRRNDVGRLVDFISERNDVVLFAVPKQAELLRSDYEVRTIEARKQSSIWTRFWNLLYLLFGNLPADLDKYADWKRGYFDSDRSESGIIDGLLLALSIRLPQFIDFDTYLKHVNFTSTTRIDDIDVFLGFTDVNDPYFLSQIRDAGKPLATYVYSWDHPAKYHRFSRKWVQYMTWNEHLKRDLVSLHGVTEDNIAVVGSTQLCYVRDFIEEGHIASYRPCRQDYVYYGGAAGYEKVALQEVLLMRLVSEILAEVDPGVKLVIRPYPIGEVFDFCADLALLPNVVIEDYREPGVTTLFSEDGIFRKLSAVANARAYVHIGSTLGIEASYFDTPIIHLDLQDVDLGVDRDDPSSMQKLIHSFHAERYMLYDQFPNVVKSREQLKAVLTSALESPEKVLGYNRKIARLTELKSHDQVADSIMSVLRQVVEPGLDPSRRNGRTVSLRRRSGAVEKSVEPNL